MPAPKDPDKREKWIERLSFAHKGKIVWNKDLTKYTDKRMKKQSENQRGEKLSKETKLKISLGHKGQVPWNKGLTKETDARVMKQSLSEKGKLVSEKTRLKLSLALRDKASSRKGRKFGPLSENHKDKISKALKGEKCYWYGRTHSDETKLKISKIHKGKKLSEEHKRKVGLAEQGSRHWNWKGGITPLLNQIYNSYQNQQWRSDVFKRDNFTCQCCGDGRGRNLEAHHSITSVAKLVQKYELMNMNQAYRCEALWNVDNGITLCRNCHIRIHLGVKQHENNRSRQNIQYNDPSPAR